MWYQIFKPISSNYFGIVTILSILILLCSFMLLLSVNPIHSLLFLVLIFILTTSFFLLLKIEFISMLFLVVYLGAIIVLFLFVVMMLNIRILSLNEKIITYFPISFFIFFGFFLELLTILQISFVSPANYLTTTQVTILPLGLDLWEDNWVDTYLILENLDYNTRFNFYFNLISNITNLENMGLVLYTEYMHVFIIGSIILLIGMLGAIILTLQNKIKTKQQDYYKQNSKNISKSIKKIK